MGNIVIENHTFVDWHNYIGEVCKRALDETVPMGGPGQIIQIDESLMRGRRKYNRRRLLRGNRVAPACQNYGCQVVGPWVFGLVWKCPNSKQDLRMFHILRHNETTLRAIICCHVAPGSTIISDQWAAYCNVDKWQGFNYIHK
uniref:ISXO2-like transposase domain-containing protein n=1 Tax=Romanomermis culicivorax TaxID=13658 RepID=A0A915L9E5_ROMCU